VKVGDTWRGVVKRKLKTEEQTWQTHHKFRAYRPLLYSYRWNKQSVGRCLSSGW